MKRDLWDAEHRCMICNNVMKKGLISMQGLKIRSWKCTKCSDTALHPEDAQKMLVLNKMKRK